MNIEGHPFPLLNKKNRTLDVWRVKKGGAHGVGITITDEDGGTEAGLWITLNQWKSLVANIKADP